MKSFGFAYEHEGSSFVFHIVARSAQEAQDRAKSMGKAVFQGELHEASSAATLTTYQALQESSLEAVDQGGIAKFSADLSAAVYQPPRLNLQTPSSQSQSEMEELKKALEAARHELTTLHGLVAFDGAAPAHTWPIDTSEVLRIIDKALSQP